MLQTICVDMDDVMCDYTKIFNNQLKLNPEQKFPQSVQGFFKNLPEIEGAIEAVKHLNSISGFQIYILTAPSERNPLCYTEKRIWIENHLGFDFVSKLIISSNKGLIKADYLIDDYIEGKGQENFEGTLLQFGSHKYPNWNAILEYFK
ncbi:hypothetical protein [Maribacter sp. R86514]|uniref:5' nucleotidase, NT5C type n=1 Tax=Maribacter sp. R86514 TaxID=3093854 RepID=UPI0037C67383